VAALGITWMLDGLEVTLAGAVSGALKASPALQLTDAEIGATASAYLAGAVLGAFFFGGSRSLRSGAVLRHARRLYALLPPARWRRFHGLRLFHFLTGAGIGGSTPR
jgi:hypothetical protein